MDMRFVPLLTLVALTAAAPVQAQLRGHGGPVKALVVTADGRTALSGSFDTSAILWDLERNAARQVLRFHDGAVNAAAVLPDGRFATSGEDARIAIWRPPEQVPAKVFEGHTAPVASLAVSPDGEWLASASWDRTVRLWPLVDGEARRLEGHNQNVNGVAFTPDGSGLVSVGYDATIRIWPLANGGPPIVETVAAPLNAVAIASDGEIVAAGADGVVYFVSAAGEIRGEVKAAADPIIALAISADGELAAAAGTRGAVAIVDRASRTLARTLVGPGLPVWSAAFLPDGRTLLTGGTDRVIRRWNAVTGEPLSVAVSGEPDDPLAAYAGDPGAEVFRACVACHTLSPDEGNRAGPTLAGIFGRRIATLPGYHFSEALKKLDIVWTPKTVSKLFEIGPATYTPGTKMPEQVIRSPEDRAALVEFLRKATRPQ